MAVTDFPEDEATRFVYHLQEMHKKRPFTVPFAIQVNGSCPNAGKKSPDQALKEVSGIIDIFGKAGFLVMLKVNALANIDYLLEMLSNPYCSGLCTTNSRERGYEGHINGGGGIYTPQDMNRYCDVKSDSVFFGGVAMQRPWRVQELIQHGNLLFS